MVPIVGQPSIRIAPVVEVRGPGTHKSGKHIHTPPGLALLSHPRGSKPLTSLISQFSNQSQTLVLRTTTSPLDIVLSSPLLSAPSTTAYVQLVARTGNWDPRLWWSRDEPFHPQQQPALVLLHTFDRPHALSRKASLFSCSGHFAIVKKSDIVSGLRGGQPSRRSFRNERIIPCIASGLEPQTRAVLTTSAKSVDLKDYHSTWRLLDSVEA